jgi:hypothetical protein
MALSSSRRTRLVRALLAILLAAVIGGRGGGVALVCDSVAVAASTANQGMSGMPGMPAHAPAHDADSGDGCDSPDRTRECPLMVACAPAWLTVVSDNDDGVIERSSKIDWRAELPTDASRQPEPPPPRA